MFYTGSWRSTGAGTINGSPSPWFDVTSGDGSTCGIAYYIQGNSTGCGNQPGGIDRFISPNYKGPATGSNGLDFWTVSTNGVLSADLSFNFAADSPSFTVTLLAEAAGQSATNKMGFYVLNAQGAMFNQFDLMKGSAPINSTVTFSPGAYNWGLWFYASGNYYYTTSSLNRTGSGTPIDTSTQHFTVFRDNGSTARNWTSLYIGAEDAVGSTNLDWNDMILRLQCNNCSTGAYQGDPYVSAPEPGTFSLFLGGTVLVAFALFKRRS